MAYQHALFNSKPSVLALLLLLWILVDLGLGQPPPPRPPPIVPTGVCLDRCNKARPPGSIGAFNFYCKDDKCKSECESCPKAVCDETATTQQDPWRSWVCPALPEYTTQCKAECDKGRRQRFYDKDSNFVDKPFSFLCSQVHRFGNAADVTKCQQTCKDHCPPSVCDASKDNDLYTCPAAHGSDLVPGKCADFCNLHSDDTTKSSAIKCYNYDQAFISGCYPFSDVDCCKEDCSTCKTWEDVNYVCDEADPRYFYCPTMPGIKWRSYKGACKDRCDMGQGGGPQPFDLDCGKAYESDAEKYACRQVCRNECPRELCESTKDVYAVIKCQGNKKGLERLEEEKRKEEQKKREEGNQRAEKLRDQRIRQARLSWDIKLYQMWMAIVGALIAVVGAGFLCHYWRRKSKQSDMANGQAPANYYRAEASQSVRLALEGASPNLEWQQSGVSSVSVDNQSGSGALPTSGGV